MDVDLWVSSKSRRLIEDEAFCATTIPVSLQGTTINPTRSYATLRGKSTKGANSFLPTQVYSFEPQSISALEPSALIVPIYALLVTTTQDGYAGKNWAWTSTFTFSLVVCVWFVSIIGVTQQEITNNSGNENLTTSCRSFVLMGGMFSAKGKHSEVTDGNQ